jgi:exodeoxyribonuclease V gamma subunit
VLHLHRSERADLLIEPLAEVLSKPLSDPMAREVVAVPTRGVERWLGQSLSHRLGVTGDRDDGVCANIDWPFPGALVYMATAAACGVPVSEDWRQGADADPWSPGRLVWPLLKVVDESLGEAFLQPLEGHLRASCAAHGGRQPRRFAAVRHLADLFDRYSVHRPEMLLDWLEGQSGPLVQSAPLVQSSAGEAPQAADAAAPGSCNGPLGWDEVGQAESPHAAGDLALGTLAEDVAWQAELFRRLRRRVAAPSLAERLSKAPSVLAARPEILPVPPRLCVFGLTRLPISYLRVLKAIAACRDVHLFLLHPSGALWDRVEAELATGSLDLHPGSPPLRQDDRATFIARNSLLRNWGRDSREMQLVLAAEDVLGGQHILVPEDASPLASPHETPSRPDETTAQNAASAEESAASALPSRLALASASASAAARAAPRLLEMLQADVRADREPGEISKKGGREKPVLSPEDRSVQVHSCHGRARQVEVVREAVLHLLAEDPSLEPRDVIVMCPDIDVFAPLITATFGPAGTAPASDERGPVLRARLADRSLRQTNPLLGVAAQLLELAASRVSAPQVLDFAAHETVRRRFGLKEDDFSRIEEWVAGTGTRWGLDREHREAGWRLGPLGELATWRAGLDRLLLGVAMAGSTEPLGGVLALDKVSSTDTDVAGRFAELVERLRTTLLELSTPKPAPAWAAALVQGTERLACAAPDEDWQHDQLCRVLEEVATAARGGTEAGPGANNAETTHVLGQQLTGLPLLDLAEATYLLADRLRGRPTRANFRTGDMTICTLVPMRSVPHRVVCLLGLDDSSFPRRAGQDGDDLLLAQPRVGDRDAPNEDRQLLLDALLAAKQHLIITYAGRDPRQNRELPPAVPVAELLEAIDRTASHPDPTRSARELVLVEHPLQAFDPRNYTAGALGVPGPWRFDALGLEGARSLISQRKAKKGFLEARLGAPAAATVQLRSLVQFLEAPARAFLRERLGLYASSDNDQLSDRLPLQLEPLEAWALGDRLLSSLLVGKREYEAVAAELARGLLPPGPLGDNALACALAEVYALLAKTSCFPAFGLPASSLEVNVRLPDGRYLIGTVPDVHGKIIAVCTYSRLKAKQRLQAWAHLLALSAAHAELSPSAVTVARSTGSKPGAPRAAVQQLGPLGSTEAEVRGAALENLCALVDLYDRGMREPLPLYCETSEAWASAQRAGDDATRQARKAWGPNFDRRFDEALKAEHLTVLGGEVPFERLLEQPPLPDESGAGWCEREGSRFGRLALRLWGPLLAYERLDL